LWDLGHSSSGAVESLSHVELNSTVVTSIHVFHGPHLLIHPWCRGLRLGTCSLGLQGRHISEGRSGAAKRDHGLKRHLGSGRTPSSLYPFGNSEVWRPYLIRAGNRSAGLSSIGKGGTIDRHRRSTGRLGIAVGGVPWNYSRATPPSKQVGRGKKPWLDKTDPAGRAL